MKKTFQRLLAATVAIPVAMTQVLSVAVFADDAEPALTTDAVLYVSPVKNVPESISEDVTFTQLSDVNTTVKNVLASAEGKEISLDAATLVDSLNSSNYYATLLKDIVSASADPTATVKDGTITISGDVDFASYIAPELEEKLAELGYGDDITLDTSAMNGEYIAEITVDTTTEGTVSANVAVAFVSGGKTYTVETIASYLNDIYVDLDAQVQKIVDDKAKEVGFTGDVDADTAALKEITDKMGNKVNALQDKLAKVKTASLNGTYDSADEALAAAASFAANNGIASAAKVPTTVDGVAAKYGSALDKVIASVSDSLADAGVSTKIDITSADLAEVANGASDITVTVADGVATASFTVEDAEEAAVEEAVEAVIADGKVLDTVTTVKTVEITADIDGAVSVSVKRDVTVTVKDPEETTTTAATEETTTAATEETTTVATEETTAAVEGTTTVATDVTTGTADETTAAVEGTTTTAATDETTAGTEETTTAATEETTASTEETDTTTTEPVELPTDVKGVQLELLDEAASNGIYLSNEESFKASDLIASVTLIKEDGTEEEVDPDAAIGFRATPADVYATVDTAAGKGNVYFEGEVEVYYIANEDIEIEEMPTVAVALKGDTDLDGTVGPDDAYENLLYYAQESVGAEDLAFDTVGSNASILVAKLAYLAADVTTASKLGANDKDNGIIVDADDAYYQLAYYTAVEVGYDNVNWDDVLANKSFTSGN